MLWLLVAWLGVGLAYYLMRANVDSEQDRAKLERRFRVVMLIVGVGGFATLAASNVWILLHVPQSREEKLRQIEEKLGQVEQSGRRAMRTVAQRYETDTQPNRRTVLRRTFESASARILRRMAADVVDIEQTLFLSDVLYCLQRTSGCDLGINEDDVLTGEECAAALRTYDTWVKHRRGTAVP